MRRHGVGTLHVIPGNRTVVAGFGMVVRPFGRSPEEMAVVDRAGLKISLEPRQGSRSAQIAAVEKALDDAIELQEGVRPEAGRSSRRTRPTARPRRIPSTKRSTRSRSRCSTCSRASTRPIVYVPGPADIRPALQLVNRYRFPAVFVLGSECYKAVDLLKRARGIPLILDSDLEIVEENEDNGPRGDHLPRQGLLRRRPQVLDHVQRDERFEPSRRARPSWPHGRQLQ